MPDGNVTEDELAGPDEDVTEDERAGPEVNVTEDKEEEKGDNFEVGQDCFQLHQDENKPIYFQHFAENFAKSLENVENSKNFAEKLAGHTQKAEEVSEDVTKEELAGPDGNVTEDERAGPTCMHACMHVCMYVCINIHSSFFGPAAHPLFL